MRNLVIRLLAALAVTGFAALVSAPAQNAKQKKAAAKELTYPPKLPDDKEVITDVSEDFLKGPSSLKQGVTIAKTPPTVDFLYYPGQTYPGNPWSNWGDSVAANGKYYASIGDHWSVDSKSNAKQPGNALVFEYDPEAKKFRLLADLRKVLNLPDGHYSPGKIHGRLDIGDDGWIYFSTHRGSTRVTTDQYHYKGDWIIRANPADGKAEVVSHGPVGKHCIPCSVLDPTRLIFYGGTAPGDGPENAGIRFFAYDCKNKKLLCDIPDGPARYMIFAKSTGRIYYNAGKEEGPLMRYDPAQPKGPVKLDGEIRIRAATQETPQGFVYAVNQGHKGSETVLYAFNTKTEKIEILGPAAVGAAQYITTIDVDPTGRYVYYIAGAHGGTELDGSPIVQFDAQTKQKKVIAFLHPFYEKKCGAILRGTFSSALDPKGDKLYVTWNISRGSRAWDCCALTVVHIPKSER